MTTTDIIVIAFLLFQAATGTVQGFLRSLIWPLALTISLLTSWTFYKASHNFPWSILLELILPVVLSIMMHSALKRLVNNDDTPRLMLISRIAGQVVNLSWGSILAASLVVLLSLYPFERFELENAGRDIRRSYTLHLARPILETHRILPSLHAEDAVECLKDLCKMDPQKLAALANDPELKKITDDPRLQKLINDPAFAEAAKKQDIGALLQNPLVGELGRDPELIETLIKAFPKIQALSSSKDTR